MEWYEAAFDRFYPILYSHRDSEEAVRAIGTFGDYLAESRPVLDMASGDGRYMRVLLEAGYDVYGFDLSHYLLLRALEHTSHGGRLVQGDMRYLPFRDGAFGSVINMFTSFGYFSADTENLLVFRETERVLEPGGVFLFDFINASRISANLLGGSRRDAHGYEIHEKRRIEQHGKYLVKHADITDQETRVSESIEERLRLYSKSDLMLMFESVGLSVVDCFGDYDGNEFVEGVSDRVIIISQKPQHR
jgi:SAM-dependent methyltransferase